MTKYKDFSSKTEDEAISAGLAELGLTRDDVSVEIIERARSGFLGIGATRAVVRLTYEGGNEGDALPESSAPKAVSKSATKATSVTASKSASVSASKSAKKTQGGAAAETLSASDTGDIRERLQTFLSGLLTRLDVNASIEFSEREGGGIRVNLKGTDLGSIIGRRGETLDAIQHITSCAVNHGLDKHTRISVDAENYRKQRDDALERLAEKMAEKAIRYRRSMALEPMNSYDRHLIHARLQDYPNVSTSSTGIEPNRRVVVLYTPAAKGENKNV